MTAICIPAYAKLNLFLHITGQRPDGYHTLQTVFCRLDFADTLVFLPHNSQGTPTPNPYIFLTCPNLDCPPQNNLIIKAANALLAFAQKHQIGTPIATHIIVHKKIPQGAGLGGGSSNAATTLLQLNQLWRLHLPTDTLLAIAQTIGADVPFFVLDTTYAIGEGIGEMLTPIALPKMHFLLLHPNAHNNTQAFFAHPKLYKNTPTLTHSYIKAHAADFLYTLKPPFYNAFEAIALENPAIYAAYRYLSGLSTRTIPRLTGTGSAVFLPITNPDQHANYPKNAPCAAFIVQST